jgi:hypothetical protein
MANRPPVKNVSGTEEVNKPLTKISTAKTEPIKPVINNPANKPADKTTLPKENAVVKSETTVPDKNVQPSEKTSGIINTTIQQKPSASNVISPITETKKPTVDVVALAANIGGRKSEFTQMVSFKSDSLELSLYDNGEIDGDTVSIFLNGEVVMSRQGLKSTAIRKTIYIKPGQEEFTLVLFAENLGKYPPNTGLLVVHDGEDVYNLRFSSDFQKNAGIIFKRKK